MGSQEPTKARDLQAKLGTDFGDFRTLMFENNEVDVCQMDEPSEKVELRIITEVESPTAFITQSVGTTKYGEFADWRDAFNSFYKDEKASAKMKMETNCPIEYRCYACFDVKRQSWDRVRVLNFDETERTTATVFFYDTMESRVVPVKSLMELLPAFAAMPLSHYRAELVDIQPVGGGTEWSKEACDFFRNHVKGKTFRTLIVKQIEPIVADGVMVGLYKAGVVMKDKEKGVVGHLQRALVKGGFAEMAGPYSSYPDMMDLPGDEYPTSFYAETSLRPRETRRDREIKQRIAEAVEEVKERTRGNGLSKKGKKMQNQKIGEKLRRIHSQLKSGSWGPFDYPNGYEYITTTSLPTDVEMSKLFGNVKIAHIHNPAWMYLQICNRLPLLEAMELALGKYVESRLPVPEREDRIGIAIVCLFQKRPRHFEDPIWARAITLSYKPAERTLKVLMVDYGAEMTVRIENTRYMPQTFRLIPSFAHRVFLNSSSVFPENGTSWTPEFVEEFRKEALKAYGTRSDMFAITDDKSTYSLTSYCQRIAYRDGQWTPKEIARDDPDLQKFRRLDNQLDNPMLHHFYTTFGVKLYLNLNYSDQLDGSSVRAAKLAERKRLLEAEKERLLEAEKKRLEAEKKCLFAAEKIRKDLEKEKQRHKEIVAYPNSIYRPLGPVRLPGIELLKRAQLYKRV